MIREEFLPERIKDLLDLCVGQEDQILRLIVEVQPTFKTKKIENNDKNPSKKIF